ncbi:MAG: serine/threonine protein kinase, partial [Blastocatellia bacterium]|nr:serine/threonine protein kinase [Blastocatellia bacterium]
EHPCTPAPLHPCMSSPLHPTPQEAEAATLVQQPVVDDTEQTRLIDRETRRIGQQSHTDPVDGLTRAGSILGTPLYMSPEQCSGGAIDARSDIYSLGVIAYRMLTGETPFTGDLGEVMRHHIEEPPPPLREKNPKVPKKVARVVMSALAKNPDERPASAEGFASALHANSEGAGAILRKSIAIFGEHAPLFLRLSLLVNLPLIILGILRLTNSVLMALKTMPRVPGVIVAIVIGLLSLIVTFLAAAITGGVIVRLVTQLIVAPLRPLYLRTAFAALKKKLRPFLTTVLLVSLIIVFGLALCIIPGFIFMLNYVLVTPVLMMEDIKGRAAMKRAKSLVRRVRRTAIIIITIHFLIPFLASVIIGFVIGLFTYRFGLHQDSEVTTSLSELIRIGMNFFLVPLYSIVTSLLYMKARQAGGETLIEALGQFEEEDTAKTKWQLRMRERIQLKSGGTTTGPSRA